MAGVVAVASRGWPRSLTEALFESPAVRVVPDVRGAQHERRVAREPDTHTHPIHSGSAPLARALLSSGFGVEAGGRVATRHEGSLSTTQLEPQSHSGIRRAQTRSGSCTCTCTCVCTVAPCRLPLRPGEHETDPSLLTAPWRCPHRPLVFEETPLCGPRQAALGCWDRRIRPGWGNPDDTDI
jgi:hypothetical protein